MQTAEHPREIRRIGFVEAYRRLTPPHSRFKKYLYSSLLATFSAVGLISSTDFRAVQLGQVILAISGSISAASLIEIFGGISHIWSFDVRRQKFMRFFHCSNTRGNVVFVLPRFPIEQLAPEITEIDLAKRSKAIKRLVEVKNQILALADVQAMASLVSMFGEQGLTPPEILWDDETTRALLNNGLNELLRIKRLREEATTFITIGLYSNEFMWYLIDRASANFDLGDPVRNPSLDESGKVSQKRTIKLPVRDAVGICEKSHWLSIKAKEQADPGMLGYDLGLVSRIPLESGHTAIIIGGLTAHGTRIIGEYVRDEWEAIYDLPDSGLPERKVTDARFAAVYDLNLDSGGIAFNNAFVHPRSLGHYDS